MENITATVFGKNTRIAVAAETAAVAAETAREATWEPGDCNSPFDAYERAYCAAWDEAGYDGWLLFQHREHLACVEAYSR